MEVIETALFDYFYKGIKEQLLLHNNYGLPEEMPIEAFFREEDEMPELEIFAMELCNGQVLDVGAGVGSHSWVLQNRGFDLTAVEISATAANIMKDKGIKNIANVDFFHYTDKKDTLLLLMNGIGLTQNLKGLATFLDYAKKLLRPGGQILFDSSNILYLNGGKPLKGKTYYGEISYKYEYKGQVGDWFNWLYVDQDTLAKIAEKKGWNVQIVYEDDQDQYLARLFL